jgi:hypothetical protein
MGHYEGQTQKKKAANISDLKKCIKDVWKNELNLNVINNLYNSLPNRISEIINNKGWCY